MARLYGLGLSGATLVLGLIGGVLLAPLLRPEPAQVVVPPAPLVESPRVEPPHLMAPTLPEPEPAPKKVTVARVPAPVVLAPGPSRDFELADERATVDMARSALARGDSTQALVVIDALAKRLPRGQLAEERESLAVEALMAAGKVSEAKARGAKFREDFPQSMLLPAVDAALEAGPGR